MRSSFRASNSPSTSETGLDIIESLYFTDGRLTLVVEAITGGTFSLTELSLYLWFIVVLIGKPSSVVHFFDKVI